MRLEGMDELLAALRACAEPTRLRILALAARGAFCVTEFTEILGQSQPRLSRHLRLLCEAGVLERLREGANAWFGLPPENSAGYALVRAVLERLPDADDVLAADRRQTSRVLAERARAATETFRRNGAEWDEMRALDIDAASVEAALGRLLPEHSVGRALDIGTGTGRLLELLAPRVSAGLGIDASRAMLALARSRLARPGLTRCAVRLADMYRLPLPDGGFDLVVMQMVLHHAEDPAAALAEAGRVLRPGGRLVVIDLAPHDSEDCLQRLAHRWAGFSDVHLHALLRDAGLAPAAAIVVPGTLEVRLWPADRLPAAVPADRILESTP
jgi:ArsR family transcriptional regulator